VWALKVTLLLLRCQESPGSGALGFQQMLGLLVCWLLLLQEQQLHPHWQQLQGWVRWCWRLPARCHQWQGLKTRPLPSYVAVGCLLAWIRHACVLKVGKTVTVRDGRLCRQRRASTHVPPSATVKSCLALSFRGVSASDTSLEGWIRWHFLMDRTKMPLAILKQLETDQKHYPRQHWQRMPHTLEHAHLKQ
jgi:hypothetical protein